MGGKVPGAWGAPGTDPMQESRTSETGQPPMKTGGGAHALSSEASPAHGRVIVGAGEEVPPKKKVLFTPKPDPWNGTHAGDLKNLKKRGPISFCRRIITFSPAVNPIC